MPITHLDESSALIVVDLQVGIISRFTGPAVSSAIDNSLTLVAAFRRRSLPVVLVNVVGAPAGRTDRGSGAALTAPAGWSDFIPQLTPAPGDILISKGARSAFTNTPLTAEFDALGVTQVVIVGVATSGGVESTARHAHEYGLNVTLPTDAMADRSTDAHDHSLAMSFPGIAQTGSTSDVLALLDARAISDRA